MMGRLTEKELSGNWKLKGVEWDQLHAGFVITEEVCRKLYGALYKLKDYEDTGLSPADVERVNDFSQSQAMNFWENFRRSGVSIAGFQWQNSCRNQRS